MAQRVRQSCALLLLLVCVNSPARGESEETGSPSDEELVERILALERELFDLLGMLPDGAEQLLAERRAALRPEAVDQLEIPELEPEPVREVAVLALEPVDSLVEDLPEAVDETVPAVPAEDPTVTDLLPVVPPDEQEAEELAAELPRPVPTNRRCNLVVPFDENADGEINSSDRHWRYFRIWYDDDRNGVVSEKEVESTFEAGVRSVAVRLDQFQRKDNSWGDIEIDGYLILDLNNDGVAGGLRRGSNGALAIDSSRLRRGSGPVLMGEDGAEADGVQPFRGGLQLLSREDGETVALNCG